MNLVRKKLVRFVNYTQQILKMKNPRHLKNLKRRPHVGINKKPKNQHNFQKVKHHAVNDRNVHHEESRLVYLNINSLRNKIVDARGVFGKLQLDYFVLSETKHNNSFPSVQFYMENFETRNRRDRDNKDGGLRFITKKIKECEIKVSETIAFEFNISKKKGFCLSVYRPPTSTNLDIFLKN